MIICIRHRWEGEMGWSQHKSPPHQARAFRRELNVVLSAQLTVPNDAVCIFSYEYLFKATNRTEQERVRDGLISPYVS